MRRLVIFRAIGAWFAFVAAGAQAPPPAATVAPPVITTPPGSGAVEQATQGVRRPATLVESFDGLGVGFEGPQGTTNVRNPSDNTLAVGPDHIVQIVNSQTAIFTKKGKSSRRQVASCTAPAPTAMAHDGHDGSMNTKMTPRNPS